MVFSDRSLTEMATYFPQSEAGFLAIHGVGRRKLAEYGERFLAAIRTYCAEHGLRERTQAGTASSPNSFGMTPISWTASRRPSG